MARSRKSASCLCLDGFKHYWSTILQLMSGGRLGAVRHKKIVKQVANRAKLSHVVTPHILRHTFATLALQKNISLAAVQKILGHDRLMTTAIYLNFTDTHVCDEFMAKW